MALTIGFIFPGSEYLYDPFRGDPHTHFQILTVLEDHFGDAVSLSLIDLRGIKKEFARYHIPECDVYLYSVYTLDYEEQVSIVSGLRLRFPDARHIAGGPHASAFTEQCLGNFDAIIHGDGEELIIEVVNDLQQGALKKEYHQTEPVDINRYPWPARKYSPAGAVSRPGLMTLRHKEGYDKLLSTTVIFSRGCPHRCAFCCMPETKKISPGIRYRRADLIEAEIEYLKREYRIQGISLLDEIGVPPGREQAIAHLEAIGRTGIPWRAQCRVDGITPEMARLMAQAGCVTMCLGIESVCQRSLDIIDKKITVEKAVQAIRCLKEQGIETRVYMILGLPGEPEDIVDRTWDFIRNSSPDLVYLSLLTIRPGTRMFNDPQRYGIRRIHSDWANTMHMFGRYEHEVPTLTFEYEQNTPWGSGLSSETIVQNYMELQNRIKQNNLGPL